MRFHALRCLVTAGLALSLGGGLPGGTQMARAQPTAGFFDSSPPVVKYSSVMSGSRNSVSERPGGAADDPAPPPKAPETSGDTERPAPKTEKADAKKDEKKDDLKDFDEVVKDAQKIDGLFTFYRKKDKLYLEIKPEQLDHDYLITITQESGIGVRGIYNGMPLQDYLFQLRRVDDTVFFVQRNPWFRAKPGQPVNRSLDRAFADSVLVAMKLESIHRERKSLLVDAAPLFKGDLPDLGNMLKAVLGAGYGLDPAKTYYGRVKSFPLNAELETYYSFNSGDPKPIEPLPDARNVTLRIRYSLSELPKDDYRPRLADDRVGYFLTAYEDFSGDDKVTPFVRYINRWNLQKKDPDAPLSEPKQSIVFWLENTIPLEYRDAIRNGVLMWNRAFEVAGFKDAIVVKQQPDDADWDPADVRYNTIRWINSTDAAFAMGPSRVNPLTGEILDADIVIDANFIRYEKYSYRRESPPSAAEVFGLPASLQGLPDAYRNEALDGMDLLPVTTAEEAERWGRRTDQLCMAGPAMAQDLRFAATALALRDGPEPGGAVPKEYLDQFWGNLVAHEVGHTLGLRHNFHASTLIPIDQMNNRTLVAEKGLEGSVMDYNPANIAPTKAAQGYYFTPRVGPYDVWAITYGYKRITAADPDGELPALREIAARSTEPDLAYATDEDSYDIGAPTALDPLSYPYDNSSDPIEYARRRMELAKTLMKRLEARGPGDGESYEEFRRRFGWILGQYGVGFNLSRWIGGTYFSRNHAGDPGERPPLVPVPASRQRDALNVIRRYLLAEDALQFAPETLNKLAPSRWDHWGESAFNGSPIDYPLLERIEGLQWSALVRMFHPITLRRLLNTELRVERPADALTLPELFGGVTDTLWSEILSGPARSIGASRRAIQRDELDMLVEMVVKPGPALPDDARAEARQQLVRLQTAIRRSLTATAGAGAGTPKAAGGFTLHGVRGPETSHIQVGPVPAGRSVAPALNVATRAHLESSDARISQALAAPLIAQ